MVGFVQLTLIVLTTISSLFVGRGFVLDHSNVRLSSVVGIVVLVLLQLLAANLIDIVRAVHIVNCSGGWPFETRVPDLDHVRACSLPTRAVERPTFVFLAKTSGLLARAELPPPPSFFR